MVSTNIAFITSIEYHYMRVEKHGIVDHIFRKAGTFEVEISLSSTFKRNTYSTFSKRSLEGDWQRRFFFFQENDRKYLSRNTEDLDDFKMQSKGNSTCEPTNVPVYLTGIFVSLSVTGILTSALGNSLVFLAVYKTNTLRTPTNYLLVSLSLASLLFIPVLASYTVSLTKKECDPIKPELCKWTPKVDFALFCVFMEHLVIISLDRLVAIKRPMRYPALVTKTRVLAITILLWTIGILEGASPEIFKQVKPKEGLTLNVLINGCLQSNKIPEKRDLQKIIPHFLFLMSLTIFVPSGLMLVTHAWIFVVSLRQYRRIRQVEDAVSKRRRTEMRAAKTVAVTVFSALACFAPLLVVTFITTFEPPSGRTLNPTKFNVKYILFPSLKLLYLLAITLTPLIYAFKSRPFKEALKRMFGHLHIQFKRENVIELSNNNVGTVPL